jgi:hypothetical protein
MGQPDEHIPGQDEKWKSYIAEKQTGGFNRLNPDSLILQKDPDQPGSYESVYTENK